MAHRVGQNPQCRLLLSLLLLHAVAVLFVLSSPLSSPPPSVSISAVTLLLPPSLISLTSTFSVSASLHAYGGCFRWTNSDPSFLSLTPDPTTSCSVAGQAGHTSITLTPTEASASLPQPTSSSPSSSRRTIWISASPLHSTISSSSPSTPASALYCEVFLDHLHHVELLTSTRRVNVGEEEVLQVQGFDSNLNVFSSLEGLPFHWTSSDPTVLSLQSLQSAGVNTSTRLSALERMGMTSHLIAVKGVTSGKATVTATLSARKGSDPITNSVPLVVLEPLLLQPRHARVCPGSAFDLLAYTRVRSEGDGKLASAPSSLSVQRVIHLPSPLYHFTASAPLVTQLHRSTGHIVALTSGSSAVSLQDNNVQEHRETSHIDVVHPHHFTVHLVPSDVNEEAISRGGDGQGREEAEEGGWYLTEGSGYRVVVRMRDELHRVMDFAPNVHIRVQVEGKSVTSSQRSISSLSPPSTSPFSLLDLRAVKEGTSTLVFTLDEVKDVPSNVSYAPHPPLSKRVPVTVTSAVFLLPTSLLLPVSPSPSPYAVTLSGGSGEYSLLSSEPSVLAADAPFLVPVSPGHAVVTAMDLRDFDNSATSTVEVAEVGPLHLRPGVREAVKGEWLHLVVEVGDTQSRAFDDCDGLTLQLEQTGEAFEGTEAAEEAKCETHCQGVEGRGCWRVAVKAVKAGRSGVKAQVRGLPFTSISFLLSAFNPAVFAESNYIAGVGSPISLGLKDGPISPPKETAEMAVSLHHLKGGREQWSTVEPLIQRVYRTGQEGVELPKVLTSAKDVRVVSRPQQGRGGVREASVTCDERSDVGGGDYLVLADVSHTASKALPEPLHSRAFTWLTCYPPLSLSPSSVSLGRGETQHLQAVIASTTTPHPLASSLVFSSTNPAVASVSSDGTLQAEALGRTLIRATVPRAYVDGSTPDSLHAEVLVEVKFESFVVKRGSQAMLVGRGVVAHIEGKNGETPLDDVFDGVTVEWMTDGDGLVLLPPLSFTANGPGPAAASPPLSVFGYSVVIVGRKAGNHSLRAHVTVGASAVFPHASSANYSVTMEVVEQLSLCGPSSLLLPFSGVAPLPLLSHVGHSLSHRVIGANQSHIPHPPAVTVSADSTLVTARPAVSPSDVGDDAVVFLSSHAGGEVQVTSLTVSVRPLRQLTINSAAPLKRWLCVGDTHELDVLGADGLGRWFDGRDGSRGDLDVQLSHKGVVRAEVRKRKGEPAGHLGVVRITGLPHSLHTSYTSVVIRVALKGSAEPPPIFLQLLVSPSPVLSCHSSPSAALISFHYPLSYSAFPLKTQKRRDLVHRLHSDLVAALDVPPSTLRIVSVDPAHQKVEVLLVPLLANTSRWHPHQWFLSDGQGSGNEAVLETARQLQAQVKEADSVWRRRGSTGRDVDPHQGVHVSAVPFNVDSSTPPSSDDTGVWTDERELEQWELRTHDSTPSPPPATSSPSLFRLHNQSEVDPYEAIAVRIQESFHTAPVTSSMQAVVAYTMTTIAMGVGGLWLLYWWTWRGQRLPPSFGLWLREGVEWLVRGAPLLVDPVKGQKVGQGLRQHAQALVG